MLHCYTDLQQKRLRHILFVPSWYSYQYHRHGYARAVGWSLMPDGADVPVFARCDLQRLSVTMMESWGISAG